MKLTKIKLGELIEQVDERNKSDKYDSISVRGISTLKKFIQTKANLNGVSLTSYKIVEPGYFAYVPDTSRRGNKISLAYNNSNDTFIVSSISIVFRVCSDLLLPEYLYLFLGKLLAILLFIFTSLYQFLIIYKWIIYHHILDKNLF